MCVTAVSQVLNQYNTVPKKVQSRNPTALKKILPPVYGSHDWPPSDVLNLLAFPSPLCRFIYCQRHSDRRLVLMEPWASLVISLNQMTE